MPDNHLTGWRVLEPMTSPGGLGAGAQDQSHPGHPLPLPHSRRVWRKKGRPLSASPPSRPHTHSRPLSTTSQHPIPEKGGIPYLFSRYKILYRPPLCFLGASGHNRSRGIAVYLLTVETRGKGGKTAFMRMSSNGKDISLPS